MADDVDWQRLLEDFLEVERVLRNAGMPMIEDYSDEQLWEEDFECWLNGERLKHQPRKRGERREE